MPGTQHVCVSLWQDTCVYVQCFPLWCLCLFFGKDQAIKGEVPARVFVTRCLCLSVFSAFHFGVCFPRKRQAHATFTEVVSDLGVQHDRTGQTTVVSPQLPVKLYCALSVLQTEEKNHTRSMWRLVTLLVLVMRESEETTLEKLANCWACAPDSYAPAAPRAKASPSQGLQIT